MNNEVIPLTLALSREGERGLKEKLAKLFFYD